MNNYTYRRGSGNNVVKNTSSGMGSGGPTMAAAPNQIQTSSPEEAAKPEWTSVFVDGDVTDLDHIVLPIKHGLLHKDTRLKENQKVVARIKPGARLAIKTINTWNNEETEYHAVRSEGWELDVDVLDAMSEIKQNAESQLYGPCIFVDFSKLPVNDDSANKRLGFWFQASDIEWKITEGS